MHKKILIASIVLVALALQQGGGGSLLAPLAPPAAAGEKEIRERLKRALPDAGELSIAQTPLPGIYRVIHGTEVFYASEDGRYLLQGSFYDLEQGKDLTEASAAEIRKKRLASLGNRMITFPASNQRYEVTVLTDVTCGYCRRFHNHRRELDDLGITVHYLLTPLLGDKAHKDAVSVWCARDRNAALTAAKQGRAVPEKTCETPIDGNLRLMESFKVRGTPAIILADGTLIRGYVEPEELLKRLQR